MSLRNPSYYDKGLELENISTKQLQDIIDNINKIREIRRKVELSRDTTEIDKLKEELDKAKHNMLRTKQRNKRIDLFGIRKTII